MYEALISHLRECAKYDKAENTFEEAADAIEELQGRAKVLEKVADKWCEAVPHWIPVTERLPKNERNTYWCYTDAGAMCECRWTSDKYGFGESLLWGWSVMDIPQYQHITHWMNLPEPPKEET